MKSPVEMKKAETQRRPIPPFAVRGQKSGVPFDIRLPSREEAERAAKEFGEQGATDITITVLN